MRLFNLPFADAILGFPWSAGNAHYRRAHVLTKNSLYVASAVSADASGMSAAVDLVHV